MLRATLSLFLVLGLADSAHAADPQATLESFTQQLQGLSGRFEQRVFDSEGRMNENSHGQVALRIPRQFRWEYETPFPQLIVADGSKLWIYDPDLEQVQVRPQDSEEQQNPLAALLDAAERERQFQLHDEGQQDGLTWVGLQPKSQDAAFSSARLGFAADTLVHMEMIDSLGQRTHITFSDWQRNPDFTSDTFHFNPPAGVDVIGER